MGPWDSRMGPSDGPLVVPICVRYTTIFPCTNHRPPFVLGHAGISMHSICVGIGEDVRAHGGLVTVGKTKSQTPKDVAYARYTQRFLGSFPCLSMQQNNSTTI